jgi:hypothetical protein
MADTPNSLSSEVTTMPLMLGKSPPKFHEKTLFYKNYHVAVPPPPLNCYYNLRISRLKWLMYLNDQLGCCAIADPAHTVLLDTSYTQKLPNPTDVQVLTAYEAVGGYDPSQTQPDGSNPTDNGCAMTDVYNYWSTTGIAGDKIAGWVQIDPTNTVHVKQAIYAFGGVHMGVQLPNSAMDQFNAGEPWTVLSDDGGVAGGHDVYVPGYLGSDWICPVTWGQAIMASWAWMLKYCDEMYATFSVDWLAGATGFSPSHLNLTQLQQDALAVQQGSQQFKPR